MQSDPLRAAYENFHARRLDEAEEGCRVVLARNPQHAEANHLLGVIRFHQGRAAEALTFMRNATVSPAATAEMHNNLGAVLNKLGHKEEAIEAFEKALAINPGYADALNNLGVIFRDEQKMDKAIGAFQRAVALKPDLFLAKSNLRSAYRDVVPAWHFAMMDDGKRNDAYEAAIRRAVPGKRVLDIGTGAGLLAMMAARAGAAKVITCEAVGLIADRAREIVMRNGLGGAITVIGKKSTDLVIGRDMAEPAEVLITEVFASGLISEGVLPTVEHAHAHLLTPDAIVIPRACSVMGYLAGGPTLQGMLFVDKISGFDLSPFNDFAPAMLATTLNAVPHVALSDDFELMRFELQKEKRFPIGGANLALKAARSGICAGIAQWIRLELDAQTRYENRPAGIEAGFNGHWTHILHRFPKLVSVAPGDIVPVLFRHDRTQIGLDLVE